MRLVLLLVTLLTSQCFCSRVQDPHKQDERTSEINLRKRCFLGRVFPKFVKTVPNDVDETQIVPNVDETQTQFETNEMLSINRDNASLITMDLPAKRTKRSCWYVFHTRESGKPTFTIKCNNDTGNNAPVSMTTQSRPTKRTETNTGNVFAKLLRILGYEVYTDQSSIQNTPMLSEYNRVQANGRKLTSAEIKQQSVGRRKERKHKLNTHGMTSAEKKRARQKKRKQSGGAKKGRRIHHGKDYPLAGGNSASSILSSVVEPQPTVRARRLPGIKTPKESTQAPLTTMSAGQTSATKWWNRFKWLFNTSVIITLPDGTRWHFPNVTKQAAVVPVTAIPPPPPQPPSTQSSKGNVTNMVTRKKAVLITLKDPVLPTTSVAKGTSAPRKATKGTWDGGNYPVLRVSDSPSHKWFPDQNRPTHRWYGDGVRPTESHRWFTDKKVGPTKKHKWFGQQTTNKPVTSHNWFPDIDRGAGGGGSHKWFGQGNNAAEDGTYWWWQSAYKLFFPEEILDPEPLIPETLLEQLEKLFKIIKIDDLGIP